jgi:hypothetical protein
MGSVAVGTGIGVAGLDRGSLKILYSAYPKTTTITVLTTPTTNGAAVSRFQNIVPPLMQSALVFANSST